MKYCAICSAELAESESNTALPKDEAAEAGKKEPALLFIGKYGKKHEICPVCEEKMDELLTSESPEGRKDALDYLYTRLFDPEYGKTSGEVVEYFRGLLSDDEALAEASRNLKESADADADSIVEADADAESDNGTKAKEASAEEENFLSKEPKRTSLGVKLVFLFLFLLVGGGTLAYGIVRSSVLTIVVGSIIILLGIGSVFAKD